jgi:hypothetical protein
METPAAATGSALSLAGKEGQKQLGGARATGIRALGLQRDKQGRDRLALHLM